MRATLLGLVLMFVLPFPARASTFSTDASDLWWNSAEGGWGVNVIQQNEVLFLTFFVYGPDRLAKWYSGSDVAYVSGSGGVLTYQGALHETTGPWLGSAFNPSTVNYRQVGSVTFALTSISTASLSYTVDGTPVNKQLTRYTWRNNNLAGNYIGASAGYISNCPGANGYVEGLSVFTITQSGNTATLVSQTLDSSPVVTCTGSGPYMQSGRMGSFSGTVACSNGTGGTFNANEVEGSLVGLSARTTTVYTNGCRADSRLAGVRRNF